MSRLARRLPSILTALAIAFPGLPASAAAGGERAGFIALYEAALANAPRLDAAEAAIESAEAQARRAFGGLLPQLEASAELEGVRRDLDEPWLASEQTTNYLRQRYDLEARQPLYDKQAWERWDQAKLRKRAAALERAVKRQELIQDLATRYFDLRRAALAAALAQRDLAALNSELARARALRDENRMTRAEVADIRAKREQARAERLRQDQAIQRGRDAIAELTGQERVRVRPFQARIAAEPVAPDNAQAWVERALTGNRRLRAKETRRAVRKAEIAQARAGHYPSVEVTASYRYFDDEEREAFNILGGGGSYGEAAVGLRFSVPLYSGGRTTAQRRRTRAELNEFDAERRQLVREIERETRNAYYDVNAGLSDIVALNDAVAARQDRLAQVKRQVELDRQSVVALVEARRDLFRAQRDLAGARFDYLQGRVDLAAATGALDREILAWLDDQTVAQEAAGFIGRRAGEGGTDAIER